MSKKLENDVNNLIYLIKMTEARQDSVKLLYSRPTTGKIILKSKYGAEYRPVAKLIISNSPKPNEIVIQSRGVRDGKLNDLIIPKEDIPALIVALSKVI